MLATDSLRTIDHTRRGQLLPLHEPGDQPARLTVDTLRGENEPNTVFVVDNLLSTAECDAILRSAEGFGLASLEYSYAVTERQADRLCIVDEQLAQLLWARLGPLHTQLAQHAPPGFHQSDDTWTAVGLNSCCRLSRYSGPSTGFQPHFDSPYVPSVNDRSALSVVLYLADVGETDFYHAPTTAVDVVGLTTSEEIAVRGGLNCYQKQSVRAKRGRCLIFPHQLLHAGAPVETGTKWVLRTDVVFSNAAAKPASGPQQRLALEWFREAQNQELDGNVSGASCLYERSLSLRRYAGSPIGLATHSPVNTWSLVLFFLDMNDLVYVSACSKAFQAWCERNRAIREAQWHKHHPLHRGLLESINQRRAAEHGHWYYTTASPHTKRRIQTYMPDYLPRLQCRQGSLCTFLYTRSAFDAHPAACLRALAMAAVYQFGVSKKTRTYVAQYDAERNRALACSARELMDAAFYERPLAGAWYHVHTSAEADLARDRADMHASKLDVREALRLSVDPRLLRQTTDGDREVVGFENNLKERGRHEYVNKLPQNHFTNYTELWQHTSSQYDCTHCRGEEHVFEGGVTKAMHYNNLICDFSRTRLRVTEADDGPWQCGCDPELVRPNARRSWIAHLDPLNISSFQHAACQSMSGRKQAGTESYKRGFSCVHTLHHLHLLQLDDDEVKDEVQDSGSEEYDEYEYDHWHAQPRQELELGSMCAPPAADADYVFVSQYAAVRAL